MMVAIIIFVFYCDSERGREENDGNCCIAPTVVSKKLPCNSVQKSSKNHVFPKYVGETNIESWAKNPPHTIGESEFVTPHTASWRLINDIATLSLLRTRKRFWSFLALVQLLG